VAGVSPVPVLMWQDAKNREARLAFLRAQVQCPCQCAAVPCRASAPVICCALALSPCRPLVHRCTRLFARLARCLLASLLLPSGTARARAHGACARAWDCAAEGRACVGRMQQETIESHARNESKMSEQSVRVMLRRRTKVRPSPATTATPLRVVPCSRDGF
jgi:hypothetical protein